MTDFELTLLIITCAFCGILGGGYIYVKIGEK